MTIRGKHTMADGVLYWLKLKRDFFRRHDIRIVESMPNGKDYVLFYLKLLCESLDHEGSLRFSDTIPYSDEMLSALTSTNIDIVRSAVKVFVELHMMELLDDGTLFMTELHKMAGKQADNPNANRQRRFRERQKADTATEALPERYGGVTKNNESLESRDKSLEPRDKSLDYGEPTFCDEPQGVSPPVASLLLKDGTEYFVTKEQVEGWTPIYPAVDITQELGFMKAWCDANPGKRKTRGGIKRFINSWLKTAQDEATAPSRTPVRGNGRGESRNPFLEIAEELEARERDGF